MIGKFLLILAVDAVDTFAQFMEHLQQPGGIFDRNNTDGYQHLQLSVFKLLMEVFSSINRKYPFRSTGSARRSFVLTHSIGVIINGSSLGNLHPSQLLKVEKLFVKAFKVC